MNLDGQEIVQLVFLLAVLALFCFSLRDHMRYAAWFKRWEAERRARREAAKPPHDPDAPRKGPWG